LKLYKQQLQLRTKITKIESSTDILKKAVSISLAAFFLITIPWNSVRIFIINYIISKVFWIIPIYTLLQTIFSCFLILSFLFFLFFISLILLIYMLFFIFVYFIFILI